MGVTASWPPRFTRLLLLASVLLLLQTPDAHAFEYPEHVQISRLALHQLLDADPQARDFFGAIHQLVPGKYLCKEELLADERSSSNCLTLADLPALAGDHASAPATLLLRWFASNRAERNSLMALMVQGVSGVGQLTSSPTECRDGLSSPDVNALLKFARDHDLALAAKHPDTRYPRAKKLDDALLEIDPKYLCLAMRSASHFRVPDLQPRDAAEASTPNALSWYARFHAQALWFASLGAASGEQATRENWWGLAVLFEMFSLHYLEDSVAAGHIVSPAFMNSTGTVRETHNFYNQRGVAVTLPAEVCALVDAYAPGSAPETGRGYPRLRGLCERERTRSAWGPIHARVHGDHGLAMKFLEGGTPEDVTLELSVLVTGVSLREVVEASRVGLPLKGKGFEACQAKVSHCVERGNFRLVIASCSAVWDEPDCVSDGKVRSLPEWGFSVDQLKAVALLPIPTELTTPKTFSSGSAFMIGSTFDPLSTGSSGLMTGVSYLLPPFFEQQWEVGLHVNVYSEMRQALESAEQRIPFMGLGANVSLYPYTRVPWSYALDLTALFRVSSHQSEWCLFPKLSIGAEYGRFEDVNVRLRIGGGPVISFLDGTAGAQLSLDLIIQLRKFPSIVL